MRSASLASGWIVILQIVVVSPFCVRSLAQEHSTNLRLVDVSEQSGISWEHTTGRSKRAHIVEGIASGLASFDFDRDGRIDLYLLNGHALPGSASETKPMDGFFRNLGEMRFQDISKFTRIDGSGYGLGICAADFDGDGFQDLFINNFGPNYLYRNCGDGTFLDVTEYAGILAGNKVASGVAFADFNGDECLDIYVGNYVDFTLENSVYIERNGRAFHAGPRYYRSEPDEMYLSNGDGTFRDAGQTSGISEQAGPTMGLIAADLNQDGLVDVFTANDAKPNFFFVNEGSERFVEDGVLSGLAFNSHGKANASMGVDLGDFDRDGRQDLIVTNYQNEIPVLYKNLGDGLFEDVSARANVVEALQPHVTWGCSLVDLDNNGWLDLYIACGHFDDAEIIDDRTAKKVRDFVLLNFNGRFEDVSTAVGLKAVESSRGVAFDDFDNDGDVDVVVLNSNAKPTVLRNDLPASTNWVQIELIASSCNRQAVNSNVKVSFGTTSQYRQVICGRGYQCSYGDRLHFGLDYAGTGDEKQANIEIHWPDNLVESFVVSVGQCNQIRQGSGVKEICH
jgi:hypothetical protein